MFSFSGLSTTLRKIASTKTAYAHCDIPCGIYDPHVAQIAALTTVRMNQLIEALEAPGADASAQAHSAYAHAVSRYTTVKEEHAELCKKELRILWGDYFRPEHVGGAPRPSWKVLQRHEGRLQSTAEPGHASRSGPAIRHSGYSRDLLEDQGRHAGKATLPPGCGRRRAGIP